MPLEIVDADADRWPQVERLLAAGRSAGACWCQWFRLRPADYDAASIDERMARLLDRVAAGPPPGLLALDGAEPVGWLSLGPAEEFGPRLSRWSVARDAMDDLPRRTWVINCLYVPVERRRSGIGVALITAAIERAGQAGASAVQAFPVSGVGRSHSEGATGVGYAAQFAAAGFAIGPGPLESRPRAVLRLAD